MPFTDEQPFLDAIFARYHDDGPRLIYADFLADSGDPERAELVRLQIALARIPTDHGRVPALVDRQTELITEHSEKWTEHLRDLDVKVWFRRGVSDSVCLDAGIFLATGSELFRRVRVRRLRLLDAAQVMPKLILSPLLAGGDLRELDLCGNDLGNDGVALLARSQFLGKLDALDLGFNALDDTGIAELAKAGTLTGLKTLALNDNGQITGQGVKSLAESPFFAGLTGLDVSGNDIGEDGVKAVAAGPTFPALHTFRVNGNHIGDAGLAALARSRLLVRMLTRSPRLEIRANAIGPAGVSVLAAAPVLARCSALDLSANYLGDRGFAALIASPHTAQLRVLKLAGNQITDAGLASVRESLASALTRLRVLDLSGNRLTRVGIGSLQIARGDSLTTLEFSGNVQASVGGEAPVPVGEVVPGVLRGVAAAAEAAELRRRVSHPAG